MGKQDNQADYERAKRAFKALGDVLRRAAMNADALELKPEVKAWLLDQFGTTKPKAIAPVTDKILEDVRDIINQQLELEKQAVRPLIDKTLEKVRGIVRQQWEQEQMAKPTFTKKTHVENEHRRKKSRPDGDRLPPH